MFERPVRMWHLNLEWGWMPLRVQPGTHCSLREIEIIRMLAEGRTNQQIALRLGLSYQTIRNHQVNARIRLGARNVVELVMAAIGNRYFSTADLA